MMGRLPIAMLLCGLQVFILGAVYSQDIDIDLNAGPYPTDTTDDSLTPDCREEQYPCTRMYSIHHPMKQCLHSLCFYSLRRVYVVNKEICIRIVCLQEEIMKAELCREKSGWPRRIQRSTKTCRHHELLNWKRS
ncbi:microfibril associated protein 5 [Polyodon spathula]|uniref:microfibril associated protein 5 n=1 Tax=Polyodon spathula TaxID=7913 RepID=UPI001B7EA7C1|nr:microfibril associated protein 5 [Polyodon spathula]